MIQIKVNLKNEYKPRNSNLTEKLQENCECNLLHYRVLMGKDLMIWKHSDLTLYESLSKVHVSYWEWGTLMEYTILGLQIHIYHNLLQKKDVKVYLSQI